MAKLNEHAQYIEETYAGGVGAYVESLISSVATKGAERVQAELNRIGFSDIKVSQPGTGTSGSGSRTVSNATSPVNNYLYGEPGKYQLKEGMTKEEMQKMFSDFRAEFGNEVIKPLTDAEKLKSELALIKKKATENSQDFKKNVIDEMVPTVGVPWYAYVLGGVVIAGFIKILFGGR